MSKKLSYITLGTFAAGVIGGLCIPNFMLEISFLGDIYVNLLKMMVVPVLFMGILAAFVSNQKTLMTKITVRTILLFIVMFVVSFLINCGLVALLQPGTNFNFIQVEWSGSMADMSLKTFFTSIFTSNIISAFSTNAMLPTILFAFAFGIALNTTASDFTKKAIVDISEAFNKMLGWVMYYSPIGVFALIGTTIANYGPDIIKTAAAYVGCAWLGCAVVCILVMILPVWIYCKISPLQYLDKVKDVWLMTMSTCSSAATLPTTIRVCNEEFDVPKEITNIVVPLGCTIHMCGGAVSFSLLALFNAQMFGITITPIMFIMMIFVALLINMGAPGIPGGGIVIGASYLSILGIPIDFIGFYSGIYRLLDMPYTTMNVTGDITANCLIKKNLN